MKKLSGHQEQSPTEFFEQCLDYCNNHDIDWDYYGKGVFKESFEEEISQYLGFEKALFLPSGVMAQLIAMQIALSKNEGQKKIGLHPTSHLLKHEEDAYKVLHQLDVMKIGEEDEIVEVKHLDSLTQLPQVLILEIPYRHLGGDMPSWESLCEIKKFCKKNQIFLHLDGARIWETQSYYKKSLSDICAGFDSAYVSFYKGIGSTSGAMLLSGDSFIEEAKVWNRRHGGDLFNLLPLLLPAKMNFDKRKNCFKSYFQRTQELYKLLGGIEGVSLVPKDPKINMFHMNVKGNLRELVEKNKEISEKLGLSIIKNSWGEKVPGSACVEIYVGENALMVEDEKIMDYFKQLFQAK